MSDDSFGGPQFAVARDQTVGVKRQPASENGENPSKKGAPCEYNLESLRRNMEYMNAETERLKKLNALISSSTDDVVPDESVKEYTESSPLKLDLNQVELPFDAQEVDKNSIYIGNVDYSSTAEEVEDHFKNCGKINRVTIMVDSRGRPKGYAYMQFEDETALQNALEYNETEFKGRTIKVTIKRKNQPFYARRGSFPVRRGFSTFRRFPRYRARRGWFY